MHFFTEDHAYNFQNMILKDETNVTDYERFALFYILGGNDDLFRKRNEIYDFKEHEIIPEVLSDNKVDFCSSSRKLVALAYNLFNGYQDPQITPVNMFSGLDQRNYILARNAIDLRFNYNIEEELIPELDEEMEIDFIS